LERAQCWLVATQWLPYRFVHRRTKLTSTSTIELVDPELRDALTLWPLQPLTADTLTQRRADSIKLIATIQTPDLPDIAADEIRVESAFGAKPIRVLSYRPVESNNPLPTIVHIHGGGFVAGAPEMKDVENRLLASELKCAIYSVDYRLARKRRIRGRWRTSTRCSLGCTETPASWG
jgi:acetyl esterase/lipase